MLQSLCKSDTWNDDELDGLGLLGLQPCFEDVILLLPIYLVLCFLGPLRCHQCIKKGGRFNFDDTSRALTVLKLFCCGVNVMTNIVLLGIMKAPAPYELLVTPFGILGWLSMSAMTACNLNFFALKGQWIPRFCFLWLFVCTAIRWPSQAALGDIGGQSYYFSTYITEFTTQLLIVTVLYFEKAMTAEEYHRGALSLVVDGAEDAVEMGDMERHSTMSFRLQRDEMSPHEEHLHVTEVVETNHMRTVPWCDSKNPEGKANILSRMLFLWLTPLFSYAHKNTLEQRDIWDLRTMFR
jgi:hypothetical protein